MYKVCCRKANENIYIMDGNRNIPEPALRRLPWYLAYVKFLQKNGESFVSTTQIANKINVSATQIAKDLSYIHVIGKTRVGYDVNSLVDILESFLGFTSNHKAILVGVGSLGSALLGDNGLEQFGMKIVAGFDINKNIIGKEINNIPIFHSDDLIEINKKLQADIGVLTVPVEEAQSAVELMIESGIKAVWNFTPYRVRVPEKIVLQNTSLYAHLAVMFNRLKEINQ